MANLLALFGTAFLLNIMPTFTPPTWMVMSWIGFSQPEIDPVIPADVATCAATVGRLVLARLSCLLVRSRWTRKTDHQNIDMMHAWLEDRKGMTVGLMLAYAFSPFPFSYIFTVYGLTRMWLWLIGLPFFVGHWTGYLTWTHIVQIGTRYLDEETEVDGTYMGMCLIVSQVVFLALVYGFVKLDWQYSLQTEHLRWRRQESIVPPARDTRTEVKC